MKKVCKTIMNRTLQDNSPITNFSSLLPISLFSLASHLTISLFPFFNFFSWLNQLHFILERKRKCNMQYTKYYVFGSFVHTLTKNKVCMYTVRISLLQMSLKIMIWVKIRKLHHNLHIDNEIYIRNIM